MVFNNMLFNPSILGKTSNLQLPEGYELRPLSMTDYQKGYLECLSNLTTVGEVSEEMFAESFDEMQRAGGYFIIVIEDRARQQVVASGSLVVEQKFIHGCSRVGHIEDIVVAKDQQGKKLGFTIIKQLRLIADATGCYKTILDCSPENVAFYEKCGLSNKGVQMAVYTQ